MTPIKRWIAFSLFVTFAVACAKGDSSTAEGTPVAATGGGAASPNATGPATSPNVVQQPNGAGISWLGRVDATSPNQPIFSWSATQFFLGFVGTKLTATLTELDQATYGGNSVNNIMGVSVDGGAMSKIALTPGTNTYALASGLTNAQHQVVLSRLTEAETGRTQFVSAQTDGHFTYTPPRSTKRIEFIGDSATCGYGADGNYPCTFSPQTEDALVAYPYVTGQLLGADVHDTAFSGKGIIANRDMVNDSYKTLPILWQRTLANDENVLMWNPNLWIPQAVVMTVGGNDFYNGVPSLASFQSTVSAFINQILKAYPGVHVFLGVSTMLRDDSNPTQREFALSACPATVTAMNNANVHYVDIPFDDGSRGYGCDEHPVPATHKLVAQAIAQTLKTTLKW